MILSAEGWIVLIYFENLQLFGFTVLLKKLHTCAHVQAPFRGKKWKPVKY